MRRSPGIGHEPDLRRLAVASFVLHVFFISVFIIPFRTGEKEFRSYHVNLVDPVPVRDRGTTAATRRARRRVPPKKTLVTKEKVTKKRALPSKKGIKRKSQPEKHDSRISTEKITKEIERLRAIKELSRNKEEQDRTREIEVVRKRVSDASITGSGIPGKGKRMDPDSYYALVYSKIRNEWVWTGEDAEGLVVIISIKIDSDGRVLSQEVEKTSGNVLFDRSAMNAVSKASPLPPPYMEMEIGLRFYL